MSKSICEHANCDRETHARGLCKNHYNRTVRSSAICRTAGCQRNQHARRLCRMHYRQFERAHGMANSPSNAWSSIRRATWKKSHARRRGAPNAETIYYESIFARDKNTCALCNEMIDMSLEFPNPMSPSIDHRIPVSAGGTHTRDNVQAAHFRCNARKGVKQPQSSLRAAS